MPTYTPPTTPLTGNETKVSELCTNLARQVIANEDIGHRQTADNYRHALALAIGTFNGCAHSEALQRAASVVQFMRGNGSVDAFGIVTVAAVEPAP